MRVRVTSPRYQTCLIMVAKVSFDQRSHTDPNACGRITARQSVRPPDASPSPSGRRTDSCGRPAKGKPFLVKLLAKLSAGIGIMVRPPDGPLRTGGGVAYSGPGRLGDSANPGPQRLATAAGVARAH